MYEIQALELDFRISRTRIHGKNNFPEMYISNHEIIIRAFSIIWLKSSKKEFNMIFLFCRSIFKLYSSNKVIDVFITIAASYHIRKR